MRTILSLLLCLLISNAWAQTDKRLKGLDKELQTVLETWNAAGFAVAVVDKDQVIYARGFGYRDVENQLPATENTLFAIGSCSKSFTSGILGVLRDQEKINFDDAPSDYIEDFSFYNAEMDAQITIQDIMCHRTGLPRHDYSWYFFPTADRDSLIQRIAYQQPTAGVREQWQYNNFMFLTQGVIAEKITKQSWEDNIRETYFQPLGMNRSNVSIAELEQSDEAAFGYATLPDDSNTKLDYYHILGMAPAGSINSSVTEMANYVSMWIQGGKFNGKQILPDGYVREAMSSHMIMTNGLPDIETPGHHFKTYGYGWMLSSYDGHYRVEHGGNINGFSASTSFFPSDSVGIVVLANQNGSAVPSIVRNIVSDRLLGLDQKDWNGLAKKQVEEQKQAQQAALASSSSGKVEGTSPSHPMEEYEGTFYSPSAGKLVVSYDNDSLMAQSSYGRIWLRHYHYDVFEMFMESNGKIDTTANFFRTIFETDPQGNVSKFTINLEANIDRTEFTRLVEEVAMESDALAIYEGEYSIAGMTAKFYIKEGILRLFVPNQPEYQLIPIGDHEFQTKGLDGYSVKFTVKDNTANEVDFIQPNGTFKATRKTD